MIDHVTCSPEDFSTTTPLRSSPSPSFPTPLSGSCSGQKQSTMPIAMYASGASHSSDSELVPIAVPTVKKTGAPGLLRGGGVEQFKFTGSNDNMKTKTSPATNLPLTTKRGADDANTAHSNKENMGPAPKRICREKTGTEWQTVLDLAEYGQESSGDGKGLDIRSNRTRTEHPPVPLT